MIVNDKQEKVSYKVTIGDVIDVTIPEATTSKSGVMSTADKTKLNNTPNFTYSTTDIGSGATLATGSIYIVYE